MKTLPKVKTRNTKRVGRGYGSGKGGHTVGRGAKGQKARSSVGILFEGVKIKKSLLRRLPLQRGKGKLKPKKKAIVIDLEILNLLKDGQTVDIKALVDAKIIKLEDAQSFGVKILGNGEISKKLNIELPISASAAKKVEGAGGKVVQK